MSIYSYQSQSGRNFIVINGIMYPVAVNQQTGQRYAIKDGLIYTIPDQASRGLLSNGLLIPAGQGNPVARPVGPTGMGFFPAGQVKGPIHSYQGRKRVLGGFHQMPVSSWQSPQKHPYLRPAGQLPSGLPTGTVQQGGGSVSGTFVAVAVGAVAAIGGLAYYLTRTARVEGNPRRRRSARPRRNPEDWITRHPVLTGLIALTAIGVIGGLYVVFALRSAVSTIRLGQPGATSASLPQAADTSGGLLPPGTTPGTGSLDINSPPVPINDLHREFVL